jgi:protein-tyrosine-phosphatase
MLTVLFVCAANRFRSPLAEAVFKRCLLDDGCMIGWEVRSAGIWTESGLPPVPSAIRAAKRLGLDIERHRSQPVTSDLLSRSDLVIVMQASQKEVIQLEFPRASEKTILLSVLGEGILYDIPDPFETMDEIDHEVAIEIDNLVKRGYKKISEVISINEKSTGRLLP